MPNPEFQRPYLVARGGADMRYSSYDVLVIGGGIGGLTAALGAARRWNVALLTKSRLDDTTTFLAQGGIAAAMAPYDSPELHLHDTLVAGEGLCHEDAVRILVEEGPGRVKELEGIGTKFDRTNGHLVLSSEGAHSVPRVVHAGGDATGSVVASALMDAMISGSTVEVHENEFVIDLLTDEAGRCVGAVSLSRAGELTVSLARAVVLACGGAGQIFSNTTNPEVATGDGHAMAYRAGALMRDMEFMQFHPTAFHSNENPCLLITEALRGEGAFLLDGQGQRFMVGAHPQAELAPRHVVVRRIKEIMDRDHVDHVWLDARHLPCAFLRERFPTVYGGLKERGYDVCTQLVPVSPVSHYFIGGVVTDLWGKTSIPGLYACGETASTGVHGANRLASNSLLEGLVFGDRVVRDLNRYLSNRTRSVRKVKLDLPDDVRLGNPLELVKQARLDLEMGMSQLCGIVRERTGLQEADTLLRHIRASLQAPGRRVDEVELFNLLTVAGHMVDSAILREESRGVHLRSDFPERDDDHWLQHITVRYDQVCDAAVVRVLEKEAGDGLH